MLFASTVMTKKLKRNCEYYPSDLKPEQIKGIIVDIGMRENMKTDRKGKKQNEKQRKIAKLLLLDC